MRQIVSRIMILVMIVCTLSNVIENTPYASAKSRAKIYKVTFVKNQLKTYSYKNAKKIKIAVSKKGIVSAKRGGFAYENLQIRGKKVGKTTITVKATLNNGKKQTYKYNVTVKNKKMEQTKPQREKDSEVTQMPQVTKRPQSTRKPKTTFVPTTTTIPVQPTETSMTTSQPESYQPEYTYKVEILNNQETLYSTAGQLIILHVITENPSQSNFKVRGVNQNDDWKSNDFVNLNSAFADVRWTDKSYSTNSNVSDGYLVIGYFETEGKKEIEICESPDEKYSPSKSFYSTGTKLTLEIESYADGEECYIQEMLNEACPEKDMDDYDKIKKICNYIANDLNYYSNLGTTGIYAKVLLREYAPPYFISKRIECGMAASLVNRICQRLGIESYTKIINVGKFYSENQGWAFAGFNHRVNIVKIDNKEYVFDATPNASDSTITEDEINFII
ncbi:MAG: hypothetical protein NC293_03540 [Roseburia sp.]|nr:hypothetical protein [Roseburia sp.]